MQKGEGHSAKFYSIPDMLVTFYYHLCSTVDDGSKYVTFHKLNIQIKIKKKLLTTIA